VQVGYKLPAGRSLSRAVRCPSCARVCWKARAWSATARARRMFSTSLASTPDLNHVAGSYFSLSVSK